MAANVSLSTDHVAAFVELARQGSLRRAAGVLHITEQGLRNRLLTLEERLRVPLYHKQRGPRRREPLTHQGRLFLPHALAFLERARQLSELFGQYDQSRSREMLAEIRGAQNRRKYIQNLVDEVHRELAPTA